VAATTFFGSTLPVWCESAGKRGGDSLNRRFGAV
jgi:hypothetical protein